MVGIIRKKSAEQKDQIKFVQYIRTFYPDLIIASIPNGAGVTPSHRIKLVHEGLFAGMPDLVILGQNGKVLWMEFKRPDGKGQVSDDQHQVHEFMLTHGHDVRVVHGYAEATTAFWSWYA
jgi:VRR-NUC domain